ncbi:nucleoporin NUP42 [Anabas testudineus]|uniref:nucleoporin NUP42 n=1 Tax=Anabas testudineus TaxID=64144 RepID=UPI000E4655D1|nr:nucleoporin NUP42 [Anabas testudineus]
MTVCNFYLQGRCRYGDKCWNEHPRGGNRGGGGGQQHSNNYNRASGQQQQQPRGGEGGFGNRVWVNPNQQKGGYIQPSSFSSRGSDDWGRGGGGGGGGGGGSDWGRGGGGRRDNVKSSEFSFSNQNRYSALDTPSTFDRGGRRGGGGGGGGGGTSAGDEDDDKKLEIIQADMEAWESSGQWALSCYSKSNATLSGFTDLSPEELRLEYYSTRASGDLQTYISGVSQLIDQWRSRLQELKVMNPATRAALLAELNDPTPQTSSSGFGLASATGFGSSASDFGSKGFGAPAPAQTSGFGFAAPSGGFGSAPSAPTGFGSALTAPTQPPSGFGSSSTVTSPPSASAFSFAVPTSDKPAATSGFGSASGFSFSSTTNNGGGLRSGFGSEAPAPTGSNSVFGQTSAGFGASGAQAAAGSGSASGASGSLFSNESTLTPEELNQFKAKRFTLGQIPLKPPPADLLVV